MHSNSHLCRAAQKQERGFLSHLRSILEDAKFVSEVRRTYPALAFFANMRCGTWYAHPDAHQCYFKSTDGHSGHWRFSDTRLNLCVAELAASTGGAIIVDSTKRGKPFPDSLTKTIPIWCAVVNHIILGEPFETAHFPAWLPSSEIEEIRKLLPIWTKSLPPVIVIALRSALGGKLTKRLRPHWVCNAISEDAPCTSLDAWEACVLPLFDGEGACLDELPVLCVSASRLVSERGDAVSSHAGWSYIQLC